MEENLRSTDAPLTSSSLPFVAGCRLMSSWLERQGAEKDFVSEIGIHETGRPVDETPTVFYDTISLEPIFAAAKEIVPLIQSFGIGFIASYVANLITNRRSPSRQDIAKLLSQDIAHRQHALSKAIQELREELNRPKEQFRKGLSNEYGELPTKIIDVERARAQTQLTQASMLLIKDAGQIAEELYDQLHSDPLIAQVTKDVSNLGPKFQSQASRSIQGLTDVPYELDLALRGAGAEWTEEKLLALRAVVAMALRNLLDKSSGQVKIEAHRSTLEALTWSVASLRPPDLSLGLTCFWVSKLFTKEFPKLTKDKEAFTAAKVLISGLADSLLAGNTIELKAILVDLTVLLHDTLAKLHLTGMLL